MREESIPCNWEKLISKATSDVSPKNTFEIRDDNDSARYQENDKISSTVLNCYDDGTSHSVRAEVTVRKTYPRERECLKASHDSNSIPVHQYQTYR